MVKAMGLTCHLCIAILLGSLCLIDAFSFNNRPNAFLRRIFKSKSIFEQASPPVTIENDNACQDSTAPKNPYYRFIFDQFITTPTTGDSFALFAKISREPQAETELYRGFHELSVTYGWCLSANDIQALKSFRSELEDAISYLNPREVARLNVALQTAYHAHNGQRRKSGEPYIIHPVAVAKVLAELQMDSDTLIAGLLHDTVEDTYLSLQDIKDLFGPAVARIVEGETKVSKLPKKVGFISKSASPTDKQTEDLCHLFFAMSEDWRVLMVKLADRLHNMRTLQAMPIEKQRKIAKETLDVFVPLANKLGVWELKTELEDMSFRVLHPQEHSAITYLMKNRMDLIKDLETTRKDVTVGKLLTEILPKRVKAFVSSDDIEDVRVVLKSKEPYSVWKEDPELKNVDLVEDLIVVRVIVKTRTVSMSSDVERRTTSDMVACYRTLDAVHAMFPSAFPRRVKDYIKYPKDNGYQSLHSIVRIAGFPVQIQIATECMDQIGRHGMSASWHKSKGSLPLELPWLQQVHAYAAALVVLHPYVSAERLINSVREQVKVRRLVLTAEGEILDLDATDGRCTVRDAALAQMKEDSLERIVGVQVNGRTVPLSRSIDHGDVVSVVTRPYQGLPRRPRDIRISGSASSYMEFKEGKGINRLVSNVWPWCLVGKEKTTKAASLGLNGLKRRTQRDPVLESFSPIPLDEGELEWFREAEIRHGRLSMAILLLWLAPEICREWLEQPLGVVRGPAISLQPFSSSPPSFDVVGLVLLIGIVEIAFSAFMTKRVSEAAALESDSRDSREIADFGASSFLGFSGGGSPFTSVSNVLGISSAPSLAAILGTLRQQELSIGRLAMLMLLSLLLQSLIGSTFGHSTVSSF